jgi:predicted negative regulator of RcsB-dependent stress response
MLEGYQSEKEQIEQIKQLWRQYGLPLVIGVVIASLAVFGWRYWQQQRTLVAENASQLYQQLLYQQDAEQTRAVGESLIEKFSQTPYAAAAALLLAEQAVQEETLVDAIQWLDWVIVNGKQAYQRDLARLRVSRIYLAQKKYQLALDTLANITTDIYTLGIAELQGDIYAAQQSFAQAREAYSLALELSQVQGIERPLLTMKLANIDKQ